MLFQSDYWFVSKYSERVETLRNFLETDEGITNLVIVDMANSGDINTIIESIKMDGNLDCSVNVYTTTNITLHESNNSDLHTKTIYVRDHFDLDTIDMIKATMPILAIFT
jgi:hypothetical protein